jgi:uncharacterized membrane protein
MQEHAEVITRFISHAVEIIAALIIGFALLVVIYRYMRRPFSGAERYSNQTIRIEFGSSIAVALELLLGADVLATAIAPTWDEIGKLAAIAVLRTSLNYFLERELEAREAVAPDSIREKESN